MRIAVRLTTVAAAIALAALQGCASRGPTIESRLDGAARRHVELDSTPFFPQSEYQCGPAALATVLGASGVEVTPDDLAAKVYIPERHGSLQAEMIAATRGYDRLAVVLDGGLDAVLREIAAGNPVLVLQNLGVAAVPFWHYAVVVGFDVDRDSLILRSGADKRKHLSAGRFNYGWSLAHNWAVVVVGPDSIPATASAERYVAAAAGLEAAKRDDAALIAYRTAHERWPADSTALLGIGNISYAEGHLADAEAAYREVLTLAEHNAAARNNLAQVLLERGDPEGALTEILRARSDLADARLTAMLAATESEIRRALATPGPETSDERASNK
ncbi:MAG TPA: PA2778 family cysteine peptidase [Steroidobacteraceae bacterium]|nr:PA2778 family cysteine peptidase [Steroidobacteraceae bacterium]